MFIGTFKFGVPLKSNIQPQPLVIGPLDFTLIGRITTTSLPLTGGVSVKELFAQVLIFRLASGSARFFPPFPLLPPIRDPCSLHNFMSQAPHTDQVDNQPGMAKDGSHRR